jgi:hypothetical protein
LFHSYRYTHTTKASTFFAHYLILQYPTITIPFTTTMTYKFAVLSAIALAATAIAASCGGGGSFDTSNVQYVYEEAISIEITNNIFDRADFGDEQIPQHRALIWIQGTAQICIVNRAPSTAVSLTGSEINDAIDDVRDQCCGSSSTCSGGQQKITAESGNVIDMSVQAVGQNCTP